MKHSTRLKTNQAYNLSELLNELERVHRDEVKLYTSGHLNPNKLFNPNKPTHFWSGSLGPIRKITLPRYQYDDRTAQMEDALSEFTIRTALVSESSGRPGGLKTLDFQPQRELLPNLPISDVALEEKLKEERKKLHDEIFKKDLKLPDLRLLKYKKAKNSRQCFSSSSREEYQFINSYLSGVTKKDTFLKFLQIEKHVIAKQDLRESDFTGSKVSTCHEKKLEEELLKMHSKSPPQYNRLQVYGDIFEDICSSSLIFGDLLKEVKNEYEIYMSILLDSQSSNQYKILLDQVKGMEKRTVMTSDIEAARKEVKRLVRVAKEALERNEKLRTELKLEEFLGHTPCATPESSESEKTEEELPDLAERIEEKRRKILSKWDEIYALEKYIKNNMTHMGIANIIESSIKSIEGEATKLETVNGILKKKIMDLEMKIKENLDMYKVSREEQQKFWDFLDDFISSEDTEEFY
ncbi:uncharacterized protein C6orf118 homolog [Antechinus flavipes]|uniref:uncharacterized protein C6orf118 homolog n=1 Tax=Antechinus flavipes TaxID=38775 RepID=UPI002236A1BE|nr:uncharacterized protein C6orf118 homolog [Antechinus flavipes]